MKKIMQAYYDSIHSVLGYGKKYKNKIKEAVHMMSLSPAGTMGVVKDPEIFSDPAQVQGIEIGDEVALASAPDESIGILAGITGFRQAIVRGPDGSVSEYDGMAVVCLAHQTEVF